MNTNENPWQKAARLLRDNAHALRESHAPHGHWLDDEAAMAAHNELIAAANEIELWSNTLRGSNQLMQRDLNTMIDTTSSLMIAMFGQISDEARAAMFKAANKTLTSFAAIKDEQGKAVYPLAGVAVQAFTDAK